MYNFFVLCFPPLNRHGFLIDVKKVLEHLIADNCNWPSVNLILGEKLRQKYQAAGKKKMTLEQPLVKRVLHLLNVALL